MNWRQVLLPRPLPGVFLWMAVASIATSLSIGVKTSPTLLSREPQTSAETSTAHPLVNAPRAGAQSDRDEKPAVIDRAPTPSKSSWIEQRGIEVSTVALLPSDGALPLGRMQTAEGITRELRCDSTADGTLV